MKEPTHISEIIESMDIFRNEPKPLIFNKMRTKKSRTIPAVRQKNKFLKALLQT
jgi:hypothetical protein